MKINGCIHDGWLLMSNFSDKLNKDYLYEILSYKDIQQQFAESATGGVVQNLNTERVKGTKIPLPPLDIQQKIVEEIEIVEKEGYYQKNKLTDLKNSITKLFSAVNGNITKRKFSEIATLEYGASLPEKNRNHGKYPVLGSNGIVGYHNSFLIEGPAVIVGRKGSSGKVAYIKDNCFPIDTTFYVKLKVPEINLKFFYFILKDLNLEKLSKSVGVPGLNRNDVYNLIINLPDSKTQNEIIEQIDKIEQTANEIEFQLSTVETQKKNILTKYLV
jgi:type I restriction enzyme S subunit